MLNKELELVPNKPGSYQMYDKNNNIIYVGKAKDLKKRLNSYFNREVFGKTKVLVNEINHFEYIITSSELEAFILELNLIKKHNPKYNILLRDDKSYPYIEYIKKPFPQLKIVRYLKIKKNSNTKLFGPYPNSYAARRIVNLINRLYPLKKCKGMPKEVCLYYHIGECLGYCVYDIEQSVLDQMETEITSFLNGNDTLIKNKIKEKIAYHSENTNYELAKNLNDELNYISIILDKQHVEINDLIDRDVINYYEANEKCSLQIFFIRHGKLLEVHRDIFDTHGFTEDNVLEYIHQFYEKHELPKEILINDKLNIDLLSKVIDTNFVVPIKGEKKKLLDLVYDNAKTYLDNNFELINRDEVRTIGANNNLKELLNLESLYRIDVFDNSNLFGNYSVSTMVVFKDGKPNKKDYRKYKIFEDKNDDYNMMKEVIYRRYQRALVEKSELPDLILIDGGINQINATLTTLKDLNLNIKVCGLVKDDNHRTSSLLDGDTLITYEIDKTKDLFHYLTRIQDEVHRYTVTYHKTIRSKGTIASILDTVEGIGSKRKKEILKKYGSINNIKKASIEELSNILPIKVSKNLLDILNKID